jgi:hypothetical protein
MTVVSNATCARILHLRAVGSTMHASRMWKPRPTSRKFRGIGPTSVEATARCRRTRIIQNHECVRLEDDPYRVVRLYSARQDRIVYSRAICGATARPPDYALRPVKGATGELEKRAMTRSKGARKGKIECKMKGHTPHQSAHANERSSHA